MTYVPQHRDQLVAAAQAQQSAAGSTGRGWRRLIGPTVAVIVAGCVPAVVVAAMVISDNYNVHPSPPGRSRRAAQVAAPPSAGGPPSARLIRDFAVLGHPQVAGDRLPAGRTVNAPSYYADQSHHVGTTPPIAGPGIAASSDAYVAGGLKDRVCLVILPGATAGQRAPDGPTGECHDPAMAVGGRTVMTLERDGGREVEVFGIVPDGVSSVKLTLADGRTSELPVNDNLYSAAVPSATDSITFTGPDGAVHVNARS